MTTTGWVALGGALAVTLLPSRTDGRLRALARAGRLATPGRRRRLSVARPAALIAPAVAAVGVVFATAGAVLGLAAAAVVAVVIRFAVDARRRRAADRFGADVRLAVRVLVGELRAGTQPPAALDAAAGAAAGVRTLLRAAGAAARAGRDPAVVLTAAPHASIRAIGLAWRVGAGTGSALADVLSRVATDLDEAAAQRRALAVALAGPRSSAAVLAGLPLLGVLLGSAMGAQPGAFLLGAPGGRLVCCAGVGLDVAGVLWMRRIVRRAEQPP